MCIESSLKNKLGTWYHYWYNGEQLLVQEQDDLSTFRFIISNLIVQNLVTIKEVCQCFNVKADSVLKQVKRLRSGGPAVFFNERRSEAKCCKLRSAILARLQAGLDVGISNLTLAKQEGLTEGSIRAAIKRRDFKKRLL